MVKKQGKNRHAGMAPQWKPGQSGNPKGRPKGCKRIPDLLRKFGEWQCPEALIAKMTAVFPQAKRQKLDVFGAVMLRVYVEALQGEPWAVQFIAERTEGKVKDTLAVEGMDAERTIIILPDNGRDKAAAKTA